MEECKMANVGCKIIKNFERPDRKLVELFKGMPVANIDDCMNRTAAVRSDIVPMNKAPLLGTAFTVKVPEGDNLMFHAAMDMAQPGDVIVIDAGGDVNRAIFGELMITYCHKRGLAGVIVDGVIRDSDEIAEMDFPVYAKGAIPNGPYKNGPGEINTVISFGGKVICPGDIIVGDGDGLLVAAPDLLPHQRARERI
jgi:RraA family protein